MVSYFSTLFDDSGLKPKELADLVQDKMSSTTLQRADSTVGDFIRGFRAGDGHLDAAIRYPNSAVGHYLRACVECLTPNHQSARSALDLLERTYWL